MLIDLVLIAALSDSPVDYGRMQQWHDGGVLHLYSDRGITMESDEEVTQVTSENGITFKGKTFISNPTSVIDVTPVKPIRILNTQTVEFDAEGFSKAVDYSGDMSVVYIPTYHSNEHFRLARALPNPSDIVRNLHTAFWRLDNP